MQRMQSTLSLAHVLMVIAGLVTFLAVAIVLRDRSSLVAIVVAGEQLDEGSPAATAPLSSVEVAANDPLVDFYVVAGTDVSGKFLARAIESGEPLLRSDLQVADQAPGRRTMTIATDQLVVSGLGLRTGDLIDLIATSSAGESTFIVAGVEIVRLPGGDAIPGFGAASASSWVTIEVSQEQALAVAAAQASASVDLVRSSGASPLVASVVVGEGGDES